MDLLTFLRTLTLPQMEAFAIAVGTTVNHLRNVAYKQRKASAALAMQIEIESGGRVTRQSLRPDDWELIWPPGDHQLVEARIVAYSGSGRPPTDARSGPPVEAAQLPAPAAATRAA